MMAMTTMIGMLDWGTVGAIALVLAPLAAVPLTVVTFHLRTLGEQQRSRQDEIARRVEALDAALASLRQALAETQRDYTGKEEWLRESLAARRQLERITESLTRLETRMEDGRVARPAGLEPVISGAVEQ